MAGFSLIVVVESKISVRLKIIDASKCRSVRVLKIMDVNERLKALLDCLSSTEEDEADCSEFDLEIDCLAEWLASGAAPASVIKPRIQAHLEHSADCKEEFDALVSILKAAESGELDSE